MKDDKTFKVGDKIIRFGLVYRIFKIKKQKSTKDKEEKIIFFRPHLRTRQNRSLVYSIPVKNIDKTNIRRPVSKKELRQLLKDLSKKSDIQAPLNLNKAMEQLSLNDPYKNVEILKCLWIEKNDESTSFSKSREDIFRLALNRLVEEVAVVSGIYLAKAREKIKAVLKRRAKDDKQNKTQK